MGNLLSIYVKLYTIYLAKAFLVCHEHVPLYSFSFPLSHLENFKQYITTLKGTFN